MEQFKNVREISVVTYNVLTPQFCNEDIFNLCKPENLDGKARWKKTASLFTQWMREGRIIAVQELCDMWAPSMTVHFEKHGYHLVSSQYSGGKFGVGIAYPRDMYELMDCNIFNPGLQMSKFMLDGFTLNDITRRSSTTNFSTIEINSIVKEFSEGSYRDNRCVSIKLRRISKPDVEFWVSTYHMPCKYNKPTIMYSHLATVSSHLNYICKETPLIFMGDLNIEPNSESYNLILKKVIPAKLEKIFKYATFIPYPFKSVPTVELNSKSRLINWTSTWKDLHGSEPTHSNVCITSDKIFVETLDYTFYNGLIPIKCYFDSRTTNYPSVDAEIPHPSDICPSDHLPMLATFIYPTKT
jgi:exonuclease III